MGLLGQKVKSTAAELGYGIIQFSTTRPTSSARSSAGTIWQTRCNRTLAVGACCWVRNRQPPSATWRVLAQQHAPHRATSHCAHYNLWIERTARLHDAPPRKALTFPRTRSGRDRQRRFLCSDSKERQGCHRSRGCQANHKSQTQPPVIRGLGRGEAPGCCRLTSPRTRPLAHSAATCCHLLPLPPPHHRRHAAPLWQEAALLLALYDDGKKIKSAAKSLNNIWMTFETAALTAVGYLCFWGLRTIHALRLQPRISRAGR